MEGGNTDRWRRILIAAIGVALDIFGVLLIGIEEWMIASNFSRNFIGLALIVFGSFLLAIQVRDWRKQLKYPSTTKASECPNCHGTMTLIPESRKIVCQECGEEMEVDYKGDFYPVQTFFYEEK